MGERDWRRPIFEDEYTKVLYFKYFFGGKLREEFEIKD